MRFLLLVCFAAAVVVAQEPVAPAPRANFYRNFQISPIGNGEKVLIVLDTGTQKLNIIAEPVAPKPGEPVTQYALYASGGITLYTKTTVTLPNPNGEGTPVEGISVSRVITGSSLPPGTAVAQSGHQSSSMFTTPPRKDKDFKMPIRMDKTGFGVGRPRIWLLWDGKKEIQVEPVDTKFTDTWRSLPGAGNHIKYLSNVYTEGSPAPRFFYIKRNKDESMTVYGDDDIDTLKAIEKSKESR